MNANGVMPLAIRNLESKIGASVAGVIQGQNGSFPSCTRGFDSLPPLFSRPSAEEFFERLKKFVWQFGGLLPERIQFLRELHLVTAMNFTRLSRNFVSRNIYL